MIKNSLPFLSVWEWSRGCKLQIQRWEIKSKLVKRREKVLDLNSLHGKIVMMGPPVAGTPVCPRGPQSAQISPLAALSLALCSRSGEQPRSYSRLLWGLQGGVKITHISQQRRLETLVCASIISLSLYADNGENIQLIWKLSKQMQEPLKLVRTSCN